MENNIPWPNLSDVPSREEVYERSFPTATFEKMSKKMLQEERLKTDLKEAIVKGLGFQSEEVMIRYD
ncbi:unnamed protein product [Arabis nemorensis]|uniref:Uncharacterized protein n=1 Tax=Arabis nemorensis TaxID=586526 RepID=A0A565CW88_9BRAS|nr:unnamed protein product [Arabis nemorensis]